MFHRIQRGWRAYLKHKQSQEHVDNNVCEDLEAKILQDGSEKDIKSKEITKNNHSHDNEKITSSLENVCAEQVTRGGNSSSKLDLSDFDPLCQRDNEESANLREFKLTDSDSVHCVPSKPNATVIQNICNILESESQEVSDSKQSGTGLLQSEILAEATNSTQPKGSNFQQIDSKGDNSASKTYPVPVQNPQESDEDFSRRLRKHKLLTIAQEFAELKKMNADALPFDLHKSQGQSMDSCSDSSSVPLSQASSEMTTPSSDMSESFVQMNNGVNNLILKDVNSNIHDVDNAKNDSLTTQQTENLSTENVHNDNDQPANFRSRAGKSLLTERLGAENNKYSSDDESVGDFDVYNIETTAPHINWESLEKQLQQAEEEQLKRQEVSLVFAKKD